MIRSMVMAIAVALAPDALVKFQSKTLALQVPAAWTRSTQEGSERFTDPSRDAWFELDVGAVQTTGMKPQVCVDKIMTSIGGEWQKLSVGRHPAAKKIDLDEDGKTKVRSVTYVGCDGKTTWSLMFIMDDAKAAQLEPLMSKIVQSVSYTPPK